MEQEAVVALAAVLGGGVAAQWLGWRTRIPAVVFLLAGGLAAGPLTGALDPDEIFGELLFPLVSVAVAVVLFEGALGLGGRGLRAAGRTVWMLLTVGAATTIAGVALASRFVLGVEWSLAFLLAAVLVVTGPTVIGPIVRAIRLEGRVAAVLEAEGTLIDPVGAILAVLVFQAAFHARGGSDVVESMLVTVVIGVVVGFGFAAALVVLLSRYVIPDQLLNAATLATVVGGFAVANALSEESGLLAVTVMGIALATQRRTPVHEVLAFNETLRILFISGLFVLLGARIEPSTLREVEWRNIAFLVSLVVVVRPVSVLLSTIRSDLTLRERAFLALTAPRGIVAAAIASVFSLRLADLGIADTQVMVSATFTVIAGTVLLSGLGARSLASRLGLIGGERVEIVVLGANQVAREVATSLGQQGATVRLLDLDRTELARARIAGLRTQRGSIVDDETWDRAGITAASSFLAMTSSDEINTLAARHAAAVIGRRHVFQLPPRRPEHRAWWTMRAGTFARPLFDADADLDRLKSYMADGWRIAATKLTDQFGPEDHARVHPGAISLFLVDARGKIEVMATDSSRRGRVGDLLVTLAPGSSDGEACTAPDAEGGNEKPST